MSVMKIAISRKDTSELWGFRMRGGAQQAMPLFIEQVSPHGLAAQAGLVAGDFLLEICGTNVQGFTHDQAKGEILRGGNDLIFVVQREGGAGSAPSPVQVAAQARPAEQRVQVIEEPTVKMGGPVHKQVQPKTYKVLQQELPASETGAGARPASIFDRKKKERSAYLNAQGPTIQKAYGQTK